MNPSGLRKRRSRSTRDTDDSAGLGPVAGGAPGAGGAPKGDDVATGLSLGPHAQTIDPVTGGSLGDVLAPDTSVALGASGPPAPCAPTGFTAAGTPSPSGSYAVDDSQVKETINVEDEDNIQPAISNARSDRRLNWSNEEDIRLVSAWLHNSIDPVNGNDKKVDQYWLDVTSTYNSTTKCNRMRNRN
ncbi:hypothetical protein E2562_037530 [Oryza meyeriana var. granulata]|uniref:Myb-like domain-containing protein n=1 Tax=Oryza meyeriana var. granulata TaxID=110450 RepID=A0A6G1E7W2_9ORYZ|nr:hypothetical protein E2562_037530 [Oryza meyeriana var. granulata]